jgi:hypothetical protein
MTKKKSSKAGDLLDGLDKTELLERLDWVQQVVRVAEMMKDWDQKSRIRTLATLLIALMSDSTTDEDQAELVRLMVMVAPVGDRAGIADRVTDEEYMTQEIRARLAELDGGVN